MKKYTDMRIFALEHGGIRSADVQSELSARYHSPATWRLPFKIGEANAFIMMNPELTSLISSINKRNMHLLLLKQTIPKSAIEQFAISSMIEEIQQTNEVEGVHSTRHEIRDAVDAVQNPKSNKRFIGMVRKYSMLVAQEDIPLHTSMDIRNLYNQFILDEVVRENLENAPEGLIFRSGPIKVVSSSGQIIHEGLFPEGKIIEAMDQALAILHTEEMDILIRVAVFHYLFGYIHPFNDGNGRMTRFISSYMLSKDYDESACLRIAYIIKGHRDIYQNIFRDTNDKRNMGDLTRFTTEFLRFFDMALDDSYQTLNEKNKQYNHYRSRLALLLNERNVSLDNAFQNMLNSMLELELFGHSESDIKQLASISEKSDITVKRFFEKMGDLILVNKHQKKYFFSINMSLLEE